MLGRQLPQVNFKAKAIPAVRSVYLTGMRKPYLEQAFEGILPVPLTVG
jgi:hypothetical protein